MPLGRGAESSCSWALPDWGAPASWRFQVAGARRRARLRSCACAGPPGADRAGRLRLGLRMARSC
eukprot:15440303-Alexandrium_andersonii.AAC.1